MNNILEIKKLEKRLGDFKLGPIDLSLKRGSIMGFIGENGAGKSTTINLILEEIKKDGGDIKIFGKRVEDLTEDEKFKIGFVFDDLFLPQDMTIGELEKFHALTYENSWDRDMFFSLCKRFKLNKSKKVKDLSRGMKMKLALDFALSHNPDLLILDEATSGLDPIAREDILDILYDFIQDENKSILISSHILSDLEKIADDISFIHRGEILFSENKDELKDKYGLISLDEEKMGSLSKDSIIARRDHKFGSEALVIKDKLPQNLEVLNASIEDIMVYMTKEKYNESVDI